MYIGGGGGKEERGAVSAENGEPELEREEDDGDNCSSESGHLGLVSKNRPSYARMASEIMKLADVIQITGWGVKCHCPALLGQRTLKIQSVCR